MNEILVGRIVRGGERRLGGGLLGDMLIMEE